ncbi:MAG TPA: hypothetical protein VL240_02905 [Candidatus Binatia bacterium]|nr:hypothetical protein [Candidatus Binatia bacterium]
MGIDAFGLPFLLECGRRGCSFETVMMIGRQILFGVGETTVHDALIRAGFQVSAEDSSRLVTEQDGYLEPLLRYLGAKRVESVDFSDYEKASIIHDMNRPVPSHLNGQFTCVIDAGSLEHVFNFPQAVKNCMEMVAIGGSFLVITPANNFMGHGFYQFSPELFYRMLSAANGFTVENMILCEADPGSPRYRVKDPEVFGGRVVLSNSIPTFMMLMARRTHAAEIFAATPQQSDYSPKWSGAVAPDRAAESRRGPFKSLAPYRLRKFLRRFRSVPDPFASAAYERID